MLFLVFIVQFRHSIILQNPTSAKLVSQKLEHLLEEIKSGSKLEVVEKTNCNINSR